MATTADIIFYGGDVITMDETIPKGMGKSGSEVEAVAIAGGLIIAVGRVKHVFRHIGPNTHVIFLNEQALMPGFIECHQHACMVAMKNGVYTDVSSVQYRRYSEIETAMKNTMAELEPGDWGLFFGWDPELIPDLPTLSASYLNANFSADVPMVVIGQSGHVAWVNSPALTVAGIDKTTESPPGGTIVKDDNGEPTGQLFEEPAMMLVMSKAPSPDFEEMVKAFEAQWKYYGSVGLTTVTDIGYMPSEGTDAILRYLADRDDCPIRVGLYRMEHAVDDPSRSASLGPATCGCCPNIFGRVPSKGKMKKLFSSQTKSIGNYSERLWEAGIKLIADGSPHCGTAAVREPFMFTPLTETLGFPKAPGYGSLNMEDGPLLSTLKRFHKEGKQVAIHCHGERASEQVLRAHEQVIAEFGTPKDNRHRMEHLGLMTVEQIARAGNLNLALSFFVDHLRFYGLVYKTDIFGDRVNRWTPLSEATKCGVTWSIHQDHPTFPGNACPLSNMKTAVTRCTRDDPNTPYGPEYRVPIHEALKAYTTNAAWQLHREKDLGSITVGKKADLVVLSKNPYNVDPFDLEKIEVINTYLEGRSNKFAKVTTIPSTNINILEPIS
ncbi:hypothetical protein HOLleu_21143 [Holothuria leucospilota]|uniref:Amidohydrolase 3 domain-containing protein n=1 Tax=Holothuria leucospilota TaxID=206669 RepID=A0A9Q1H6L7_HOLLE|nr:hypothetical protein HOLleu_21143 [Holothuria leucospilota]